MRSAGFPVEVLIEQVALIQQGDQTVEAGKEILKERREQLASPMIEMQKTLEILDHQIEVHESPVLTRVQAAIQTKDQALGITG